MIRDLPAKLPPPFALALGCALGLCLAMGLLGSPTEHGWAFMALWAIIWCAAMVLVLAMPKGLGRRSAFWLVLGGGILARLCLLPAPESDDVYRYLWEGRVLNAGFSPYVLAPDDPALMQLRDDFIWPLINHPDQTACYPPLATMVFAGLARAWYSPMAVKTLMALCDASALALLLAILARKRLPLRWAWLYAMNPLLLAAMAGQGHLDAMQVLGITATLWAWHAGRPRLMFLCLGLAVQAKYAAILGLPFVLTRDNARHAWVFTLAAGLPFAAFLARDGSHVFASLVHFGSSMAFNGPVHWPLRALLGGIRPAAVACTALLALVLAWAVWRLRPGKLRSQDPAQGMLVSLGALLLLSPTVHFWYLSWIAPLFILRRSWAWLLPSLCTALSLHAYALQAGGQGFMLPPFLGVLEWTPAFLALGMAAVAGLKRLRVRGEWQAPDTVSVIVPCLNEEAEIAACIRAIQADPAVQEIVVADGGSSDRTRELAQAEGARVVLHHMPLEDGGGRGGQILAGLEAARGDLAAVVHADCRPGPSAFTALREFVRLNPGVVGGSAGTSFPGPRAVTRLVEAANDLRAGFLGLSFGDQIQFVRRKEALELGLMAPLPLMEDVELSLRLKAAGASEHLWQANQVSDRGWKGPALKRTLLVLRLFFSYIFMRLYATPDTRAMFRRYYGASGTANPSGRENASSV